LIASDHPHHELFVEPCSCHYLETKKYVVFLVVAGFSFSSLYRLLYVCVWSWSFRAISSNCAFLSDPATGYAESKWRAVLDVPKFSSIELDFGGFRVARRFAECAC
jgi:hypothetical protein